MRRQTIFPRQNVNARPTRAPRSSSCSLTAYCTVETDLPQNVDRGVLIQRGNVQERRKLYHMRRPSDDSNHKHHRPTAVHLKNQSVSRARALNGPASHKGGPAAMAFAVYLALLLLLRMSVKTTASVAPLAACTARILIMPLTQPTMQIYEV